MAVTKCPLCGGVLFLSGEPGNGWQRDAKFEATASPFGDAPMMAGSWSKSIPHSKIEPRDVLTSLMDAGVTALFCGVAGGGLAAFTHADPIGWAGIGAFCGAAFRYFDGMGIARNLTQAIEEWTSAEPETPTKPAPVAHVIRAETVDQNGNWRFASIDVPAHILSKFANDVELSEKTFSERTATGAGMTQAQFSTLRDQFIESGWARWNHPERKQNGVSLTKKGEAIIRAIASEPLPPTTN